MKCARCDKMHNGIKGLIPRRLPGQGHNRQKYEMLCRECHVEAQRERDAYREQSRGT